MRLLPHTLLAVCLSLATALAACGDSPETAEEGYPDVGPWGGWGEGALRFEPRTLDFGFIDVGEEAFIDVVVEPIDGSVWVRNAFLDGEPEFSIVELRADDSVWELEGFLDPLGELGPQEMVIRVRYAPVSSGIGHAQLTVYADNALGEEVFLDVVGATNLIDAEPCPLDFGRVGIDGSVTDGVELRNVSDVEVEITSVDVDGGDVSMFRVEPLGLEGPFGAEDIDRVLVTYNPTDGLQHASFLEVEYVYAGQASVMTCVLSGRGRLNHCPVPSVTAWVTSDTTRRGVEVDWAVAGDTVVLDGRRSTDPDDDEFSSNWGILQQPDGAVNGLRPWDNDPGVGETAQYLIPTAGLYRFGLVVTDEFGCASAPLEVLVVASEP